MPRSAIHPAPSARDLIEDAVIGPRAAPAQRRASGGASRGSLLERAFARMFRTLVYAQIWEDPVADMGALDITPDSRMITIASGGCNALSYLTADPCAITVVDLNTAHIALNRLKHAALDRLEDYDLLRRFIIDADHPDNPVIYRAQLAPFLDAPTRHYWEGRDLIGRRRIGGFAKGIYRRGLLGRFIGMAHVLARFHRIDPREILSARDLAEQRRVFEQRFAPVFEKPFVRWLTGRPAALFGLGIPPAQYSALAGDAHMADVLRARLEKLACHFPINDNYFAWQAFSRGYGRAIDAPLPPWLQRANVAKVRQRLGRITLRQANFVHVLRESADASFDRFVLLDAQDWMDDAQLSELWREITRTAAPGARVLFRTAAAATLLPGRVPHTILDRWEYDVAASALANASDRASIYGGVHLYVLKD